MLIRRVFILEGNGSGNGSREGEECVVLEGKRRGYLKEAFFVYLEKMKMKGEKGGKKYLKE